LLRGIEKQDGQDKEERCEEICVYGTVSGLDM